MVEKYFGGGDMKNLASGQVNYRSLKYNTSAPQGDTFQ
jgi:hypothetical protein